MCVRDYGAWLTHRDAVHDVAHDDVPVEPAHALPPPAPVGLHHAAQAAVLKLVVGNLRCQYYEVFLSEFVDIYWS